MGTHRRGGATAGAGFGSMRRRVSIEGAGKGVSDRKISRTPAHARAPEELAAAHEDRLLVPDVEHERALLQKQNGHVAVPH